MDSGVSRGGYLPCNRPRRMASRRPCAAAKATLVSIMLLLLVLPSCRDPGGNKADVCTCDPNFMNELTIETDLMTFGPEPRFRYRVMWDDVRPAFLQCPACIVLLPTETEVVNDTLEFLCDLSPSGDPFLAAISWAAENCDLDKDLYLASVRRADREESMFGVAWYDYGCSFIFNQTIEEHVWDLEAEMYSQLAYPGRAWVTVHELGHQFGLGHHHPPGYEDCVMQSTDVALAVHFWDLPRQFCEAALDTILWNIDSVKEFRPPEDPPEERGPLLPEPVAGRLQNVFGRWR
jgi:hypothetical protein